MTLSTRIYAHQPVDWKALFTAAQEATGSLDAKWTDDDGAWSAPRTRMNLGGQGYPAWVILHHNGGDRPIPDDGDGVGVLDGQNPFGRVFADLDFDTGYGYRDEHGGCNQLHARLIRKVGAHLDAAGVPWSWRYEYDGSFHEGLDGLDLLDPPPPPPPPDTTVARKINAARQAMLGVNGADPGRDKERLRRAYQLLHEVLDDLP